MRDYFILSGKDSREFGCYMARSNMLDSPEADRETIEIPGRNGDLIIDNERFKNFGLEILAYFPEGVVENARKAKEFIGSIKGYTRYEESTDPQTFREVMINDALEMDSYDRAGGYLSLKMTCKPQRFLKSGEIPEGLSGSGSIYNPTSFPAFPSIKVRGTGTIQIGNQLISISKNPRAITIDGETMEAMEGDQSVNSYVALPEKQITLSPGVNNIGLSGTTIEITPNWWTI